MKYKNIIKNFFLYFLIVLSSVIWGLLLYLKKHFHTVTFEQLLYNLLHAKAVNALSLTESIVSVLFYSTIFLVYLTSPLLLSLIINKKISFHIAEKKIILFPIKLKKYTLIVFILSLSIFMTRFGLFNFLQNQMTKTQIYETYYTEYEEKNLIFPQDKQNLIMIYVESFENSIFSKKNGGTTEKSLAPNLEKLANNPKYINFSNTEKIGGFRQVPGTNWTIAALTAQTSGVPIYIKTKNNKDIFLEGVTTIGEILEKEGYKNIFMLGSDANFAERKDYFTQHGNYLIYDYVKAKQIKMIPENYFVWWGYEDDILYYNAKSQLKELSKNNQPFNFTLLTADTHFYSGFTDNKCPNKFEDPYANSYYCTDIMLSNFIDWITKQDFYENTTVVIAGDHLTMRDDYFDTDREYNRTVFNLFLNSKVTTKNNKNRDFVTFDMFPTTLAALGVKIKNERIALGTNLFSNKKTLVEEIGYKEFTKELEKKSNYYNEKILKN